MRDLILACESLYITLRGEHSCGAWVTFERLSAVEGEHGRHSATPGEPSVWRASIGESPDTLADHDGYGDDPEAALRDVLGKLAAVAAAKRDTLSGAIDRATGGAL